MGPAATVAKLFLILFCHSLPLGLGGVNELSLKKKKKKKAGRIDFFVEFVKKSVFMQGKN